MTTRFVACGVVIDMCSLHADPVADTSYEYPHGRYRKVGNSVVGQLYAGCDSFKVREIPRGPSQSYQPSRIHRKSAGAAIR